MATKKAYRYDASDLYEVREHDQEYLNVGGVTRQVRIYQPEGPGPFPMLLSIHGGAWTDKDHTDYGSTSKPLAATGFLLIVRDYQSVTDSKKPYLTGSSGNNKEKAHGHEKGVPVRRF